MTGKGRFLISVTARARASSLLGFKSLNWRVAANSTTKPYNDAGWDNIKGYNNIYCLITNRQTCSTKDATGEFQIESI
jgi:hypothetical protein